ncbi:MAG: acyl-CoA dehydrogenase family protein [Alphaproteobacteria bacterium]|jgi:acyl-CoA dehydrogenase|nr:acyl-CoA dehydrogenase family protein [Alphaproteobacteria bacterium]
MNERVSEADFDAFMDGIGRLTRDVLIPSEPRLEDEDGIPEDIVGQFRSLGLFGVSIPPEYGGLGLGMEQQVRLHLEICRASAVYRSRISTTIGLGSQPILHHGTEAQRRRYLPKLASGEWTAAFALTEPEAGSDAGSLRTTARRQGNGYAVDGAKRYITNAPEADLFVVMARTDTQTKGAAGISAFLVEAGTAGLVVGPADRKMGQAGSHTAEVSFTDCRVPAEALIGGREGEGFKTAMRGINHARLHVAATCTAQAGRLVDEALAYALERRQFEQPIAEFQSVQNMLAESRAEQQAARAMVLEAARRFDAGEIDIAAIACCKLFASEMVTRVADRAVQIHGGAGYMHGTAVERLYRDVRLFRIFEGTSEIQRMLIAREMIKAARA